MLDMFIDWLGYQWLIWKNRIRNLARRFRKHLSRFGDFEAVMALIYFIAVVVVIYSILSIIF